jgi:hypothetical protein
MNQNVKLAEVSNTWKFASTSLNLLMGGAYLSIWTNSAFAAVLRDCQCLSLVLSITGAGVTQSLLCLTTDWTTGVRSPAEAKDFSSSLCPNQL